MSKKLNLLPPEPIQLLDDETIEDDIGLNNNKVLNPNKIVNYETYNCKINSNYVFSKVFVGNSTLVRGDRNGTEYIVWRITLILKPQRELSNKRDNIVIASPRFDIYKRYSEFEKFRNDLISHLNLLKKQDLPENVKRKLNDVIIPKLPPKVPWYNLWEYYEINLDPKWLLKRRKGLEFFLNSIFLNKVIVKLCRDIIKSFIQTI
ncbi:Ypt35p PWA37_005201 [Arxiozyma heterogenica]|uniref:Endosomal/vacuolar adapter protein YPT35 n=1 Tax=Arxiozyma heterogenica TaxID=278026 RepID=A0AAN7W6C3_9SACH|nr:hypothetical protein RI543_000138 [Kazachstania heterogenica]